MPAGITVDEYWNNDGADLVIWTNHFTTFAAYTVSSELAVTGPRDLSGAALIAFGALGAGVLILLGARARRPAHR